MARIILKWRYIKPGTKAHNSNLVKYIATRQGVDKIDDSWRSEAVSKSQKQLIEQILRDFPEAKDSHEYQDYLHNPTKGTASEFISCSIENNLDRIGKRENYVRYIANRPGVERFGTHGLFTDAGVPIDLQQVADTVAEHDGILMTQVLSLRREDAARPGYENGEAWRDLLRGHTTEMAEAMGIPLSDLRWYAAFHNESHHPHCHIIAYSVGRQPYMTQAALMKLKSSFAREIFKQDLLQVYQAQTQYRDALSQDSREKVRQIVEEINRSVYHNEKVETMIRLLSQQLRNAKGKKVYGYLPQSARDLVNNIIDELGKDGRIAELYGLWYQQRDAVVHTYQDSAEERIPLSQNKTFHAIKNIVISEALALSEEPAMPPAESVEALEKFPPALADAHTEAVFSLELLAALHSEQEQKPPPSSNAPPATYSQPAEGSTPPILIRRASVRLLGALARMLQEDIHREQDQKAKLRVDRKQLQKIAEKKQAQGLRLG